jgi:hypothetical protein
MPSDELNRAIQLIQAGQNEQAQVILQGLIRTNQQDLEAWSWYVRSCPTPEKRLNALELCLRFNPGNPQIMEGIQKMREKVAAQQPPPIPFEPAPVRSAFKSTLSPYDFDEIPEAFEEVRAPAPAPFQDSSQGFYAEKIPPPKIEKFASGPVNLDIDETPGRPLPWYEVWWIAVTQATLAGYTTLLRDPLLSVWRASWWIFLSSLVTSMVFIAIEMSDPELGSVLKTILDVGDMGTVNMARVVIVIGLSLMSAILSIFGLMLNAWFYSLLARAFGGTGTFSRTFYLKAAHTAPLSLLSFVGYVPCIGFILSLLLGVYILRLDILSIQAAHRLNGGRSTIVVLLPTLLILLIACVGFIVLTSMLPTLMRSR